MRVLLLANIVNGQLSSANEPCITDGDCVADWETCNSNLHASSGHDSHFEHNDEEHGDFTYGNGVCTHKSMFPMLSTEFFACFLIVFLLAFTNTGGLGGGGIVVPAMMGVYHFDTRNAVSISNFSIAISTSVRYFMNLREPHPLK